MLHTQFRYRVFTLGKGVLDRLEGMNPFLEMLWEALVSDALGDVSFLD